MKVLTNFTFNFWLFMMILNIILLFESIVNLLLFGLFRVEWSNKWMFHSKLGQEVRNETH